MRRNAHHSESRTGTHPYSIAYAYDEVGNCLTKVEGGLTTTYVYDAANQLLSQETRDAGNAVVSQGTSSYDANGNLLQQVQDGQTTSYAWNAQNFLIQTTLPGGAQESYYYCGEGIRRKANSNAGTRLFIRDGKNILLEADAGNSTLRRYTHMSDNWGELVSLRQGSTSRFYGFDGSANTRTLTDASAGVSDAYFYSAFGEELQVTGSSVNPLRFGGEVGYYRDTMKRIYVRARHLDIGAGRWLSRDPIGFGGGDWNLYGYVGNDPSSETDPSGLAEDWLVYREDPFAPPGKSRVLKRKNFKIPPKSAPVRESKAACFQRLYVIYASNSGKYHYGPKKACDTANRKCGSRVKCGPAGPYNVRPYEGGCNSEDVPTYAEWIRGTASANTNAKNDVCGGVDGADKLAHCWAACMAATCGGVLGSSFIRRRWPEESDPLDINAEDWGLRCSMENRLGPWRINIKSPIKSIAQRCMNCCTQKTYNMEMY